MRAGTAVRLLEERVKRALGGGARAQRVLVLGAVLGLDGADKGTVSAMAGPLKHAFSIGNTEIGLLATVVAVVGGVFTIPVGALTDRVRRTRLLAFSTVLWVAATAMSGFAPSYLWLLVSRAALGAVTATSGPTVASLTGDYFPVRERARTYGSILAGELAGTALGFAVSGTVGSALGWRFAFWWLVIPGVLLVWAVWRLPEPVRGSQGRTEDERRSESEGAPPREDRDPAKKAVAASGVTADEDLVLREDPRGLSLWRAVGRVLRVRTNLVLIVASALGYFFFSGLRSFATLFTTHQYGVSNSVASLLVLVVGAGALVGVLAGGRVADRLLGRRRPNARVLVPTVCLLAVPVFAAPAIHTTTLLVALPLLISALILLGAVNPPLDAARLDIIHPYLWGRAEGVRTVLRTLAEGPAPTLFGFVSSGVFGGPHGLEYTLLVFLLPLFAAGLLGLVALRTYPKDVATAEASARAIRAEGA
ncbi:MFS transporter [Streptomyces montanisoli]|uniref:MFS transporter n=1 Tax=Streptomyces montanisoli TaxID=2798581 RepID=A0A940MAD9_9ACTN|nr:MFS transporter [Streptomyces montanisoli]MBP0456836.1 MFS transporter [Streptomyces montanisoli]